MTSSGPRDDPGKKGTGLGKVLSRVKIALRRSDSSKAKPPAVSAPVQLPPTEAKPDIKTYDARGVIHIHVQSCRTLG